MRKAKITGCGKAYGERTVRFGKQERHYIREDQTLLDIIEPAVKDALKMASITLKDIDLIVGAMATPLQPLPCNASLVLERLSDGDTNIPCMDINTSCTSFIAAFDVISYMVDCGRYKNVLIVSGDTASAALNPNQKESFELFSDAATAFVISQTPESEGSGVVYSSQKTWPAGVHDTEIFGGGAISTAFKFNESNKDSYYFNMKGKKVLSLCARVLPEYIDSCFEESGFKKTDMDHVFPHQASKALPMIMSRMGFKEGSYTNKVTEYGNMISAAVPYVFCEAIEEGRIKRGDKVLIVGTAAGLSVNFLILEF